MRNGIANHAQIRFDHHPKASVNVAFTGTPKPGEAPGADIDIDVKPGTKLHRLIRELGKELTAETAKQSGHKLDMHDGEAPTVVGMEATADAGTEAARTTPAKKSRKK